MEPARPSILLVDDDELVSDFVVNVLEPRGYAVETSGPAASLSRLEAGDIDLVLLDMGWPESRGLELCLHLRESTAARQVPVIALTDYPDETRDVLAYGVGPDEYLTKPFSVHELLSAVARHCPTDR
jgi:DNA-binding response OmpR family regulator